MTLVYPITPEASLGSIVLENPYLVHILTVGTHVGGHNRQQTLQYVLVVCELASFPAGSYLGYQLVTGSS